MNFKKKVNGSWADTPHYIHKTDTDTITTLPADIYPNATTATVGLKGNMSQTGTPSPDSPVMPEGTGERTGNLFDPNFTRYYMGKGTNNRIGPVAIGAMFYIKAAPNTQYTIKIHTTDSTFVRLYLSNAPIVEGVGESYNVISESETVINPEVTISNTDYAYLWIQTGGAWYTWHGGSSIMVNSGSTALPYEPYGYKIPISSANTTTPVYLGEIESTRRIKKLVLTGTNADGEWKKSSTRTGSFCLNIGTNATVALGLCDRAVNVGTIEQYDSIGKMFVESSGLSKLINLWLFDTNISLDDFKSYLAQQYAAGTPVTVWYVLATAETAVVNEPIRKIGEYADEVSGVSIPVTAGGDTLSVDTTVQPSEVTINYKGWHPVQNVHERDNGAWT